MRAPKANPLKLVDTSPAEKCDGCKFYRMPKTTPGQAIVRPGACRRYPQLIQKETWDWCGEYQKGD